MSRASTSGASSATRETILRAALDLLAREGHQALTVRRVAAEAGCSTIGVYTWFGSKDGLVDAMWVDGFQSLRAYFREALERTAERDRERPLGALQTLATAYRSWGLQHPMHYRVMFLDAARNAAPSVEAQVSGSEAFLTLVAVANEGIRAGEIGDLDPDALALALWAFVHGHVALEVGSALKPPPLDLSNRLEDRAFHLALDVFMLGLLATTSTSERADGAAASG